MHLASIHGNGGFRAVPRQPSRQPSHNHAASASSVNHLKLHGRSGLQHRPRLLSKASDVTILAQSNEQHMPSGSADLMMQWLASQVGVQQPKVAVDLSQPAAGRRLIATHALSAGELVLRIPLQRVFADTEVCHGSVNSCMTAASGQPYHSRHVHHAAYQSAHASCCCADR